MTTASTILHFFASLPGVKADWKHDVIADHHVPAFEAAKEQAAPVVEAASVVVAEPALVAPEPTAEVPADKDEEQTVEAPQEEPSAEAEQA